MPSQKDDVSLAYNLSQCLQPLAKLRKKKVPLPILASVKRLENIISICIKLCAKDATEDCNYQLISKKLSDPFVSDNAALRMYFSKSPYWEHFQENMADIISILNRMLDNGQTSFERRYVPLTAVLTKTVAFHLCPQYLL